MPMLDMPLEQLKKYEGINPRPADFDEYWEKALAEMNAVNPDVEIKPADFKTPIVDCYDMYFTGVNGARIYTRLLKPKKITGKCPALLHFHGYRGKSDAWGGYMALAASGFIVAAMDCRGQAGKSTDVCSFTGNTIAGQIIRGLDDEDPQKLAFRDVFLDTAELAKIVMDMDDVDETRVGVYGGSQGGALTIACAALEPRICRAAPQYPFLCDYKRVWEMDLAKDAYAVLKTYFRVRDPKHEREDEIFTKLGYIDLQYLAPRIKADVRMATGLMDNICPPSTQFAAYNKMTCKKDVYIYPDFGHEGFPEWWEFIYEWFIELL